jgi:hypothetical protein
MQSIIKSYNLENQSLFSKYQKSIWDNLNK